MRFDEVIRNRSYWVLDKIKGGNIKRNLINISQIIEHPESPLSVALIKEHTSNLINHAVKTTQYYKDWKGIPFNKFPVVNKSVIRNSIEDFISSDFQIDKLFTSITSGSTGTPFKFYHDKGKRERNNADTIYFARLSGYEIGHRLLYLKIWVKEKMQSNFKYWCQNIVPVDVINLSDQSIGSLIAKIEHNKSTFGILGYASALDLICQYIDRNKTGPCKGKVKSILAISESLDDYTVKILKEYFGIPVLSRYSNLENGIIAQQEINCSRRFLINTASYKVEILKIDSDEPVIDGDTGRIVVTDLFNYAMPMVRYDTGDIGAIESDQLNASRKFLSKVEGRKLDLLYDTNGNLVSSYIVYKNMWQYTEIDQYQLIQEGERQYTFKINSRNPFTRELQLIDEFKKFLGDDADFKIQYVNEIPLLSSGKRKKIVNNYLRI